ncbi:AGE family epimerase/isomerase [Pseudomonas typographi]|uniref:D-mannose isomerase n=1 Tax=Pseudomonas typographi TaxID=2715964 RepID=UPI001685D3FD|nr:AGE family epimerase/isomerase [Pseudomonas typographi]MBD1552715.1 AGE family epimerase/isomerase [Pseudomonas typographi]
MPLAHLAHLPRSSWLRKPGHHRWLEDEGDRLLAFARAARMPGGFGSLDGFGRLPADAVPDTTFSARMTHCFALAHLLGLPGYADLADHGLAALAGPLRDAEHGGWFSSAAREGSKGCYVHAFVCLAASSAYVAERPGAQALLEQAAAVYQQHFWADAEGAFRESFARDWQSEEPYRGANSNMHSVEACLALAAALSQPVWLDRALAVAQRVVHERPGEGVNEHFDLHWQPLPDYNRDAPEHPFRPYGLTPGHAFEWARLLLELEAARKSAGLDAPPWLFEDAHALFRYGVTRGWAVDGLPGVVYTVNEAGAPIVRERLHWTLAEACAAAATLLQRCGDAQYEQWYQTFWGFIDQHLIDRVHGSWHHELDPANQPAGRLWPGKADLYHAYQATLIPRLPLGLSLARWAQGH